VFSALSDPTRRAILSRLTAGEASVGELAAPFKMSQPAVSKHLQVLERAGLIERSIAGSKRPARARIEPLTVARAWLEQYRAQWEARFTQLDALLLDMTGNRGRKKATVTNSRTRRAIKGRNP
jgi:DNA-binding transcriptional ArsR family regulator